MIRARHFAALFAALALLSPARALAWPHYPTQGVPIGAYASTPLPLSDGSGGAFIVYYQWAGATAYDLYAQHYDASGAPLWNPGGVVVCNANETQQAQGIISDGAGGMIVVWRDQRPGGGNADLYAQRLNAGGAAIWAGNGLALCSAPGQQERPHMVPDGGGGAWVAWADYRDQGVSGIDLYMQHVGAFGSVDMGANGAPVCTSAGNQDNPRVAADLYDAYVAWDDPRSGPNDIYVQKMSATGFGYWTANGLVVCDAINSQLLPKIESPAPGHVVISWMDGRGGPYDIYAQKLDTFSVSGQWGANGMPVCTAAGDQLNHDMALDQQGGVVLAWQDGRNAPMYGIYAQRLDPFGSGAWGSGGALVTANAGSSGVPQLVADGLGGAVVYWMDNRVDQGNLTAQRLSSYGSPLWAPAGLSVSAAAGMQTAARAAMTPNGTWFAWNDYRPASTTYAYMQFVDRWGYLGAEPVMAGVGDVPNDQGGRVRVAWYGSPLDTDPAFNNITSYIVFRSVPAPLAVALERTAPLRSTAPFTALGGRTFRRFSSNATTEYFWEEIARVTARHLSAYSAIVPTEGDSVSGSNPRTSFMVMAEASYGSAWWTSASDSAYSVDNLAPAAPAPFTGQYAPAGTALHWNPNTEPDLASYRLYRGSSPSFVPGAGNRVAEVPDTGYVDVAGVTSYYKLTAVDSHGNESPAALLQPSGTTGAEDATGELAFRAPSPNPASRATTLRFALPRAGVVRLAVYDAAGRQVRELARGERGAGEQAVTWDLRDDAGHAVGAGLYFARFEAGEQVLVRRVAVTK